MDKEENKEKEFKDAIIEELKKIAKTKFPGGMDEDVWTAGFIQGYITRLLEGVLINKD